jgi:hypothetical protein
MPHPCFSRDTENAHPRTGAASQSRKILISRAAERQATDEHSAQGESEAERSAGAPARCVLWLDLLLEPVLQSLFFDAQPDLAGLCVDLGYGALRGSSQLSCLTSKNAMRKTCSMTYYPLYTVSEGISRKKIKPALRV